MSAYRLKQIWYKPRIPTADFSGKTVIVTGANVGLGIEAVKHFVRCGAAKVIATVRSKAKGEATVAAVEADTKISGIVKAWELEYASYTSVKEFCARAAQLDRIDAVVLNAGVATRKFEVFEGDESCITVNVINAPDSLQALSDPNTTTMYERYPISKLVQLLAVRPIADRTANKKPLIIINTVSPGLCVTDLARSSFGLEFVMTKVTQAMVAWTAEEGGRTLFHTAVAGLESYGLVLDECKVENSTVAPWIETEEGKRVQEKIWKELTAKLEGIQPGISKNI